MVGFALGTAGYPFCLTLSASIFSKVVGGSSDPVNDVDDDNDYINLIQIEGCVPLFMSVRRSELSSAVQRPLFEFLNTSSQGSSNDINANGPRKCSETDSCKYLKAALDTWIESGNSPHDNDNDADNGDHELTHCRPSGWVCLPPPGARPGWRGRS